ncbi:MAG: hypothetical protein DWI24_03355, partial [Planctomycetota bacterium]
MGSEADRPLVYESKLKKALTASSSGQPYEPFFSDLSLLFRLLAALDAALGVHLWRLGFGSTTVELAFRLILV